MAHPQRTYESALSHLASLQSNLAVTSLFQPTVTTASGENTQDLNALAIPEMLAWLGRAGIDAERDLAGIGSDCGSSSSSSNGTAPRQPLRCIHVAGTKGKGSVCAYLTSILTQPAVRGVAGRVGTYTSPHLLSVRERIMIDGEPLAQELFARYFFEVWDAFTESAVRAATEAQQQQQQQQQNEEEQMLLTPEKIREQAEGPASKPFFFRFLTIMAFHVFLREGVRSAVVECGIGGEYDSTNVLPAGTVTTAVVSQLGIDHVGMLGGTVPEIAWHKAGVFKPGRACFTRRLVGQGQQQQGEEEEEIMRVLRGRAAEKGARLVEVEDDEVDLWWLRGANTRLDHVTRGSSLDGELQKYNQALAIGAAREHLAVLQGKSEYPPPPPSPSEDEGEAAAGQQSRTSTTPTLRLCSSGDDVDSLEGLPPGFSEGLRNARLRGRCETREDGNITWLIDGAHTADSLHEVGRWFTKKCSSSAERILVFNQQERDVAKLLGRLLDTIHSESTTTTTTTTSSSSTPFFDHAIMTRNELQGGSGSGSAQQQRDLTVQTAAAQLMRDVSPGTTVAVVDNVGDAVEQVRRRAAAAGDKEKEEEEMEKKTLVLVTGSLHLVGAVLRTLEPEALL